MAARSHWRRAAHVLAVLPTGEARPPAADPRPLDDDPSHVVTHVRLLLLRIGYPRDRTAGSRTSQRPEAQWRSESQVFWRYEDTGHDACDARRAPNFGGRSRDAAMGLSAGPRTGDVPRPGQGDTG